MATHHGNPTLLDLDDCPDWVEMRGHNDHEPLGSALLARPGSPIAEGNPVASGP